VLVFDARENHHRYGLGATVGLEGLQQVSAINALNQVEYNQVWPMFCGQLNDETAGIGDDAQAKSAGSAIQRFDQQWVVIGNENGRPHAVLRQQLAGQSQAAEIALTLPSQKRPSRSGPRLGQLRPRWWEHRLLVLAPSVRVRFNATP
jgi:hypothetical protein